MKDTILYIDCEVKNLSTFQRQFGKHYNVLTAQSTIKADEILKSNYVQIIVYDQLMPVERGLEYLKRISVSDPEIFCIILTAYSDMEVTLKAINHEGTFKFMLKPWNANDLLLTLDHARETYTLRQQNKKLLEFYKSKNEELRISEKKFRDIYHSTSDGILIIDYNNKVLSANQTSLNLLKINEEELNDINIFNYIIDVNALEKIMGKLQKLPGLEGYAISEFTIKDNHNQIFTIETRSRYITFEGKPAVLVCFNDISERKRLEKEIFISSITGEENERSRVAKELHDGLGPILSTCKIYMHDLKDTMCNETSTKSLQILGQLIEESLTGISEISNNLSPHVLRNYGLVHALKNFITNLKTKTSINIKCGCDSDKRLSEVIEITIYRVLTELLNNSMKHARASNIILSLQERDQTIFISYDEDGIGFDFIETCKSRKGLGLYNMQSRIQMIGGRFVFRSENGQGVLVTIEIPI